MKRPISPKDGRCVTDATYHDRIRTDAALFDKEAMYVGIQQAPGLEFVVGLCRGCGTTVTKILRDDDEYPACRARGLADGQRWRNRVYGYVSAGNPQLETIQRGWYKARDSGIFGPASRVPRGRAWEVYKAAFVEGAE